MDLATIWSVVDRLQKKPTLTRPVDNYNICVTCNKVKIRYNVQNLRKKISYN